jgi:HAD superfamily hydrolase (TIGR01509 family)
MRIPESRKMRAVVWDMDGTLIDSADAVPAAFVATVLELEGPATDTGAVVAAYSLGRPEIILEYLLGRPLRTGDSDRYYRRLYNCTVHPYPGVRETVRCLQELSNDVGMAVFTGASRLSAEILLTRAGLAEWLCVVVGGDDVSRPKPAPDGILEACRRLKRIPEEVAYIGDSPNDLLAARAAGAVAIAAGWGHLYDPNAEADVTLTRPDQILGLLS